VSDPTPLDPLDLSTIFRVYEPATAELPEGPEHNRQFRLAPNQDAFPSRGTLDIIFTDNGETSQIGCNVITPTPAICQ
jgi:hypothetical protein